MGHTNTVFNEHCTPVKQSCVLSSIIEIVLIISHFILSCTVIVEVGSRTWWRTIL